MTRRVEAILIAVACGLAGFGILLVNLASGGGIDAEVWLTSATFLLAFGGFHLALRRWAPQADGIIIPPAALLTAVGLIEVFRLNPYRAGLQRWWLLIAATIAATFLAWLSRRGLANLRRYRYLFLAASLLLLAAPLLPEAGPSPLRGFEQNGSRLWLVLELGFTSIHFQPGELAKLALIAFLASFLAERQGALTVEGRLLAKLRPSALRQLGPALIVASLAILVLVSQRDLGASLLLFGILIGMLYTATGGSFYPLAGLAVAGAGGFAAWRIFPHVQTRVTAWLTPFSDFDGAGYQVAQGWFGLGSGSLSGAGFGLGRPDLIPNAYTDYIFAAVGEELGFAGSAAVIALFAVIVAAGFGIALRARDRHRKLLAAGLAFALALQTFLIVGGVLRLVPLTGITLPLMSYGGSSLVSTFLMFSLLARVSHEEQT